MKIFGILVFILALGFTSSCKDDEVTVMELTASEKQDLLYMREEEKLARDVYDYLYAKYDLNIFNNIGKSEQRHMDKLLTLINKYNLEDPVALSPDAGKFGDAHLQSLYDTLIAKGDMSLEDALLVGATIEDVDIFDLDEAIDKTNNTDLLGAYANLNCGSRNHMRAFNSQLGNYSIVYSAQYITQAKLEEVLSGDHEQCGQ